MFKRKGTIAIIAAAALLTAGCSGSPATEPSGEPSTGGDLDALIEAAQAEGELTFYLTPPEATGQALADAFYEKYEIEANFVRLTGGELSSRYSAEADAGAVVADLVMPSYEEFVDTGMDKGWLLPLNESDVPGLEDFPEFGLIQDGRTAVVQFAPSGLSWNTKALGDLPAPKTFEDLADPMYAGKVLLTDPQASQAYAAFWTLIINEYGLETVEKIGANTVRFYNSVVPMTESLAAGEGAVTGPNVGAVVAGAASKGAPVEIAFPDTTTGPEIVMAISADAPNPNAARLFASFVLTKEAQKIMNDFPGNFSAYDQDQMPKNYQRIDRKDALANAETIYKALGAK